MPEPAVTRAREGFRPDVEGLRAVAVALVVAYHAGWRWFPGGFVGVDVFFVLSGFLITGLLADEVQRTGTVSFGRFYGRRARRLLPMSTLVLIAVALVFGAVISPIDRPSLLGDVGSAAAYVSNWHFAQTVDYLHDPAKSPVLHYWSLSVEEQFYVVWPLLLVLVTRRRSRRAGHTGPMAAALAIVGAGAFVLSVLLTSRHPASSYYGLHTRAWELAAGGLLALGRHRVADLPGAVRGAAAWVGLALVAASAVMFSSATLFPGTAAALPVLGTVAVMAGGGAGARFGVPRMLALRPLTYVGRISYAWYLWHWPCLVFARLHAGGSFTGNDVEASAAPSAAVTLAAVVVSFALAVISHHALEDPVRRSAWLAAVKRRSLVLGAALTTASLGVSSVVLSGAEAAPGAPVTALVGGRPTAGGTTDGGRAATAKVMVVRLRMSAEQARADRPAGTRDCYAEHFGSSVAPADCTFGDVHARRTIALVGDSHAEMWFPGLLRFATERHYRLLMWTKAECPFVALTVAPAQIGPYVACDQWRGNVLARLRDERPDIVVVAHSRGYLGMLARPDGTRWPTSQAPRLWAAAWRTTAEELHGVAPRVVVLRDTPTPRIDVPACIARRAHDLRACSFGRAQALSRGGLYDAERAVAAPGVAFVDLTALLCPSTRCPVVWATGIVMYRDTHHLTASLARTLGLTLGEQVVRASRAAR